MSYRNPGPLLWYPPASAGISLTPSGTAWTSGAWATVIPAAPGASILSQLAIECPSLAAANEFEIDFGRGPAGSEVVLGWFRGTSQIVTRSDRTLTLPIPMSGIGAGDRVASRIRLSTTEVGAWLVKVGYYDAVSFTDDHLSVQGLRSVPAAANGVALTMAGSPAWTQGAWAEITPGFTDPTLIVGIAIFGLSSTDFAIDLGTGAAGTETVASTVHGVGGNEGFSWFMLPRPYRVAASTRVAARLRQSSTGAGTIRVALLYYGDVVTSVPPPPTGGDPLGGTDPDPGISLCGGEIPVAWLELETGSGTQVYSKVDVALDGTFKEARVNRFGQITRQLSTQDGLNGAIVTSELIDTDRVLRGLADAGTLLNRRCDYYLSTAAAIRTGATARRVMQGIVSDFQPRRGFKFSITVEDFFTSLLGEFFGDRTLPQRTIPLADFPNLPERLRTKPIPVPIGYGLLSDESLGTSALGVCPLIPVGQRSVPGFSAEAEEFLLFGHATGPWQSLFIPTGGGLSTGTAEPSRTKLTTSIADVIFPGTPGWTSIIGSNLYRDYNGNRYSTCFMFGPRAALAVSGQVPLVANVPGVEDVGDGTGDLIDSLPLQVLHLITNFMLQNHTGGNWLAIPTIGTPPYARVRSSSFHTVKTASEARIAGGYKGAFILGWDGQVHTFRDVIREACVSGDFQLSITKDGQVAASMLDVAAASVRAWDHVNDILEDAFDARRVLTDLANRLRYRYQRRYAPPVATVTPDAGEFLPRSTVKDVPDWYADDQIVEDATSIANHQRTKEYAFDLPMVREQATADDVAARVLARRKTGPVFADMRVNLCGTDVELGDNQTVTHPEGPTATGWSNRPVRAEQQTLDLDELTVLLTQRDLTGL